MSQRPGGVEPLDQHLGRAHPDARKPPKLRPRTRANISATGIPTQIHPQHQRVDEEPHQIIQTGSERPAIGKPTATSEVPPSLPNNTANAACTTMKAVALYCRANPASTPAPQQATHRHRGTPVISHHRIRPIRGQHHPLSHPRQRLLPIRQLRTDHTARIIKIPNCARCHNV